MQDRSNAIDAMSGVRLQNVKQCFTLINKTGEGLRMGYGYGGVGYPMSVTKGALQDVIEEQCYKNCTPRASSEFARLFLEKVLLIQLSYRGFHSRTYRHIGDLRG